MGFCWSVGLQFGNWTWGNEERKRRRKEQCWLELEGRGRSGSSSLRSARRCHNASRETILRDCERTLDQRDNEPRRGRRPSSMVACGVGVARVFFFSCLVGSFFLVVAFWLAGRGSDLRANWLVFPHSRSTKSTTTLAVFLGLSSIFRPREGPQAASKLAVSSSYVMFLCTSTHICNTLVSSFHPGEEEQQATKANLAG